jgi:hypothetical protein
MAMGWVMLVDEEFCEKIASPILGEEVSESVIVESSRKGGEFAS